jgi:hypothetical protein
MSPGNRDEFHVSIKNKLFAQELITIISLNGCKINQIANQILKIGLANLQANDNFLQLSVAIFLDRLYRVGR